MLVVATQDACIKILPLAFGVVDSENDFSWKWFFKKSLKSYDGWEDMIIVLDRHKSIIKGASKVYPEVLNKLCIFHRFGNIKSKFRMNLKKIKRSILLCWKYLTLWKKNWISLERTRESWQKNTYFFQRGWVWQMGKGLFTKIIDTQTWHPILQNLWNM